MQGRLEGFLGSKKCLKIEEKVTKCCPNILEKRVDSIAKYL
jgi:hypothetical protein